MSSGDLKEVLCDELSRLKLERDKCEEDVRAAVQRRDMAQAKYEALRRYIELTFGATQANSPGAGQPASDGRPSAYVLGQSPQRIPPLVRQVVDVLSRAGPDGLHYREILAELSKHGTVVPGAQPAANLLAYMGRFPNLFVRLSRGTYGLREQGQKPN